MSARHPQSPAAQQRQCSPSNFWYALKFSFSGTNCAAPAAVPAPAPPVRLPFGSDALALAAVNEAIFFSTLPSPPGVVMLMADRPLVR